MTSWMPNTLFNIWRKYFGRTSLDDPRPNASRNPYTFYLPPKDYIDALAEGDIVKLIFCGFPIGRVYEAERMWVKINERNGSGFKGMLANEPFDMPQLKTGDSVTFMDYHIIDIDWDDEALARRKLTPEESHQIWERCFVDDAVLDGSVKVEYLYRETPDMTEEGDKYKDSGWRFRGDVRSMTEEQYENGKGSYVALGKVLNEDDSWITLIDSPVGSAFLKNWETGEFEPTDPTS